MRLTNVLTACSLACAVLPGCQADAPVVPELLRLGDDPFHLEIAGDARTITLRRRESALLTFPADGFQLGTVPELRPNASYDPWRGEAAPNS